MEPKSLYIYPWPVTGDDLSLLKAAKASLDLDFLVVPQRATVGSSGRVLALREVPPFICDHALVRDPASPDALKAGLEWAVTKNVDKRATLVVDMLSSAFGAPVRELTPEDMALERISTTLKLDDAGRVPVFR